MEVLLQPAARVLVARLGALSQRRRRRQPQRADRLGAPEDVRLRRDEGERAVLAVHEHLPAELLAQQVLGGLVVDRAYDVGDDPHGVRLLELPLDDAVARRVVVVHARRVDEHRARLERLPAARVDAHLTCSTRAVHMQCTRSSGHAAHMQCPCHAVHVQWTCRAHAVHTPQARTCLTIGQYEPHTQLVRPNGPSGQPRVHVTSSLFESM